MRGALTVRIDDGEQNDLAVTRHVEGLRFTKVAPGGHQSASMKVIVPRSTFTDLGPADRVYIYDARTGATVWEGYTENPGVTDGPLGQEYDLSAVGGMVLTTDNSRPMVFVDRTLSDDLWERWDDVTKGATTAFVEGGMQFQFPGGQAIGVNSRVARIYMGCVRAGQRLNAYGFTVTGGKIDASYGMEAITRTWATGLGEGAGIVSLTTTPTVVQPWSTGWFPAERDAVQFRLIRYGAATNVADDNTWGRYTGVVVRARTLTRTGGDAAATSFDHIWADEVVNHLLGAALPGMDRATAEVVGGTTTIDQLTYHDGATPRRVLEDLSLWEPDRLWEVLESNPTNGLHRFRYRAWPTTARYQVSVQDGYSAPGGDVELCNRIAVYWNNASGAKQTTVVTSSVPALGTRVRDADPITLPDGMGSAATANAVGAKVLATKNNPPIAARAVVRRHLTDALTGREVAPWELEPGYLVRVLETGDLLRLTEMTYNDDDCSADLTLGEPVRSFDQLLAAL